MMAGVTIAVALTTLNMCVFYIMLCFGSILNGYGDVDIFDLKNALNLSLNNLVGRTTEAVVVSKLMITF